MIQTKTALLSLFPQTSIVYKTGGEIATPCPFCEPGKWSGTDRFYFPARSNGAGCRQCQRAGRKSWFTFQDIVDLLAPGEIVSEDLLNDEQRFAPDQDDHIPEALEDAHIEMLHQNVVRPYWYKFGFTDAVIDHFQLGYGKLRPGSKKLDRHIIPLNLIRDDGERVRWALEGRLERGDDRESKVVSTAGLTGKRWCWLIETTPDTHQIYLAEGMKDAVAAFQIGFPNVLGFFGAHRYGSRFADLLFKMGYRDFILAGDNDEAGVAVNQQIAESLQGYEGITVRSVKFEDFPVAADTTNILERHGDHAMTYILEHFDTPKVETQVRGFIPDFTVVRPDYVPAQRPAATNLDEYRSRVQKELNYFLTNYKKLKTQSQTALVSVFAPLPGAGKSYAMVQEAERMAKDRLADAGGQQKAFHEQAVRLQNAKLNTTDPDELKDLDEQLEAIQRKIKNQKVAHVLYAGPFVNGWQDIIDQGADSSLWFNYEARHPDNCQDFDRVTALAAKGYTARTYCNTGCEFKDDCLLRGYLSQDAKRLKKPITYVRHPSLQTSLVDDYKVIMIDENPLAVFDTPLVVDQDQLIPSYHNWENMLDLVSVDKINRLIKGLRRVLSDHKVLSGHSFLTTLNEVLGLRLNDILDIDQEVVDNYQPESVYDFDNIDQLPLRCVPIIYQIIRQEWYFWQKHQEDYNTRIHTDQYGHLIVYPLQVRKVAKQHPIVVADGTALPELYGLLFDRKPVVFSPEIYNPASKTTVLYGSDFTRTTIRHQAGKALNDFEKWVTEQNPVIEDIFGETFDLSGVGFDETLYESVVLQRAFDLVKTYADKHSSLLVVTYKPIRALLEHRFKNMYPDLLKRVQFGHYGALRGTNRYKDTEAVLLIGCFRQPYEDLYRRIQAWGWLRSPDEYIPYEIEMQHTPYHSHWSGNTHPTIADDFASQFVDMVELGEAVQSMERIRIHTSRTPKFAYLAMNRPVAKYVSEVQPLNYVLQSGISKKYGEALNYVRTIFQQTGKFPIVRDMQDRFKIAAKTYAKIKDEVKNEPSQ